MATIEEQMKRREEMHRNDLRVLKGKLTKYEKALRSLLLDKYGDSITVEDKLNLIKSGKWSA